MNEEVNLDTAWAVIELPETCVEAVLECKVYIGGEIVTVNRPLSFQDIKEAFKKAEDGYIDEDDRFALTDKGREYLDELEAKERVKY